MIRAIIGNRNLRRWALAAISVSRTSERRATSKPLKAVSPPDSQPNHLQSAPTNAPNAITAANAKMPAEIERPRRRKPLAIASSTARMRSAQATYAPEP